MMHMIAKWLNFSVAIQNNHYGNKIIHILQQNIGFYHIT